MTTNEKVFQVLESTGLNWSVEKRELFDADGNQAMGAGIYRSDSQKCLGLVYSRYVPTQNKELVHNVVEAADGFSNEFRGGELSGGSKVFIQARLDDAHVKSDTIERYITALSSNDGKTAISFGTSNTTVICSNTFYSAYRGKNMSKVRHTENQDEKLFKIKIGLQDALKQEELMIDIYNQLAKKDVQRKHIEAVQKIMIPSWSQSSANTTRTKNLVGEFKESMELELDRHGSTLWGLFSAATYHNQHVLGDGEVEEVMIGGGARRNQKVFSLLKERYL